MTFNEVTNITRNRKWVYAVAAVVVLFLILGTVLAFARNASGKTKKGVIFTSDWQASLVVNPNESFFILVPYYLHGYPKNTSFINDLKLPAPFQLHSYSILPEHQGQFNEYEIQLFVSIAKLGTYTFDGLHLGLDTIEGNQNLNVGSWNIVVKQQSNLASSLKMISGTGGTQGNTKPKEYSFAFAVKNVSNRAISFVGITYNNSNLQNQDQTYSFNQKQLHQIGSKSITIGPGQTFYYQSQFILGKHATGYTVLKPGLEFIVQGKQMTLPYPSASVFALDETDSSLTKEFQLQSH